MLAAGWNLFISKDDGVTWNLNDSDWGYDAATYFASKDSNIFAATYYGINLSTNNGLNWSYGLDNNTWPQGNETSLFISETDLFVGSSFGNGAQYGGIWRRPLSDFGISSVAQTPATTSSQIQIYPNPFSQSTQITFTSQAAGYAEVSIVNMLGVEVARLFSGELGVGEHDFVWNCRGALQCTPTDGIYECLVRMNGQVQTLPVVLMR